MFYNGKIEHSMEHQELHLHHVPLGASSAGASLDLPCWSFSDSVPTLGAHFSIPWLYMCVCVYIYMCVCVCIPVCCLKIQQEHQLHISFFVISIPSEGSIPTNYLSVRL